MEVVKEVKDALNKVVTAELGAINQYFLHARALRHWGYEPLGKHIYKRSIEVMRLCDDLIQRIFIVEGLPNLQRIDKILVGQTVKEVLEGDVHAEKNLHQALLGAIEITHSHQDFVTEHLLINHQKATEDYLDWLEEELSLFTTMGEQNYLARMAFSD